MVRAVENVKRMCECVGVGVELRLGREKRVTLDRSCGFLSM